MTSDPRIAALETRLQAMEDRDAIVRLKAAYCNAVDGGWDRTSHDGSAVARLFTPEGIWSAGAVGEARGAVAIEAMIDDFFKLHFAFHCIMNPDISVTGDRAEGEWHFLVLLTHVDDGPLLAGGIYRDRFERVAHEWRFSELYADLVFLQPMDRGWDDVLRQNLHPRNLQ